MTTDQEHVVAACDAFDEMATLCEQRARTWDDAVKARQYQQIAARLRAELRDLRLRLSRGRRIYRIGRSCYKLRKWLSDEFEKHALLTDEDRADEALAMKELHAERG